MMTSKAISKVMNMSTVKIADVSNDFHSAMRPISRHESDDENEARHIKPQPLRDHDNRKVGTNICRTRRELFARDERLGSPVR